MAPLPARREPQPELGDASKARDYFGKVVEQAGDGGNTRVEVADARKYLAGH